ncbi:universal stress protein [Desulfovibrio mangrovi]|uniref:universal stress protein n=1 Tax=Desulfovibrio mangrovi TaxID=2976983 RepID=UPI00224568F8|nr:universal stress protein [Desulfovibrio mangrovi]UZP67869.1 universal stress protein [Desulfovibrio mangrovi]
MLPTVKKVLYATDLSPAATHALGFALSVAQKYGAELTVLHVIPELPQEYGLASGFDFTPDFDKEMWESFKKGRETGARTELEKVVREACVKFGATPVGPEHLVVRHGRAVEVIVDEARRADLVVMGTQGHGRIGGLLMGSVAQGVLAKCETPVMVVRVGS